MCACAFLSTNITLQLKHLVALDWASVQIHLNMSFGQDIYS